MPSYCTIEEAWGDNFEEEEVNEVTKVNKVNKVNNDKKFEFKELDGFTESTYNKSCNSQFPFDESTFDINESDDESEDDIEKCNMQSCNDILKHLIKCKNCYNIVENMMLKKKNTNNLVKYKESNKESNKEVINKDKIIEHFKSKGNNDTILYSIFGILLIYIFDSIIQNKFSK